MANSTRLQVDLDRDALRALDAIMVEVRNTEANRKIGAGTIAARLLESLVAHPDIIQSLLVEYANKAALPIAAEQRAEYAVRPKKAARTR